MRQKIFSLFALLAMLVGAMPTIAQPGYVVDFETPIVVNSTNTSTTNRDFKVADGWKHIVGYAEVGLNMSKRYVAYYYHQDKGVDGTACLQAATNSFYDNWEETNVEVEDFLVTPPVSGAISLAAKLVNTTGYVRFYTVVNEGGELKKGQLIAQFDDEELNTTSFTVINLPEQATTQRIAIQMVQAYIDNFTATTVDLTLQPGLSVLSLAPNETQKLVADANGNFTVTFDATVQNTGEVDLTAGTENYSLTLKKFNSSEEHTPLTTVAIAEDLAKGATTTTPVTLSATLNTADYPTAVTNGISFRVYENITNTFLSSKTVTVIPYEPGIEVKVGRNTYKSGAELYFGYSADTIRQEFIITNTGGAPLQITGVTLPAAYQTDLAACTIEALASDTFHITLPNTQLGEHTGAMVISNNAGDMTLNLRATIVGGDTYFVDFETDAAVDGMLVEQTGSGSYSTYGWQTRKTNSLGYPGNTYSAESNLPYSGTVSYKLITPLLQVAEGDVLSFEAGKSYNASQLIVYYSADRKNWKKIRTLSANTEKEADLLSDEASPSGYGKALKQFKIATIPAGQWYVAFETTNAGEVTGAIRIDNIYGYKRVNLERDVMFISSNIAPAAQVNHKMTAQATLRNLKQQPIAAGDYTARLYFDNQVQQELATSALNGPVFGSNGITTAGDVAFDFTTTPHTAGTFNAYIQFEFTDGSKLTSDTVEVTVENEVYSAMRQVGEQSTTQDANPINYYYKKTQAVNVYSEAELLAAGITPGTKISKVAFKGYNTSKAITAPTTLWLTEIENEELINTGSTYSLAFAQADSVEALTPTFSGDVTLEKAGSASEPAEIFTIDLPTPYIYNGGNLMVMTFFNGSDYTNRGLYWLSGSTNSKLQSINKQTDSETFGSYDRYSKTTYRPVVFLGVEAEPNTVSGKVTDAETGAAMANVEVKAVHGDIIYSDATDAEGNYSFAIMQDALDYELQALVEGYFPATQTVNVLNASQTANIALQQAKGLFIESSELPTAGMQNFQLSATAKATNYTTTDFAAGSYTASLYWGNEVVAQAEAVELKKGESHDFTFVFTPHKADSLAAYIVFTQGANTASTDAVGLQVEEEALPGGEMVIGSMSNNDRQHFYIDGYNNDGSKTIYSDIVYTAQQLKDFGLTAGMKIMQIAFKATSGSKSMQLNVTSWVGLSTGDIVPGQPDKTAMTEVKVYDPERDDLIETRNLESVIDLSASPLVWDGTSDIRVYTEQQPTGPYNTMKYDYDNNYKTAYYNGTTASATILAYFTTAADALTLSGTVKNAEGEALENASVTLVSTDGDDVQYTGTTDATGAYSISVIQSSRSYKATVAYGEYENATANIEFADNSITKNFVMKLFTVGDANQDGEVTTGDAVAAVNFALEREIPSAKALRAADVNQSGDITVSDAVAIVILALNAEPADADAANARIDLAGNYLTLSGTQLSLVNNQQFVGFQMDVTLAPGAVLNSVELAQRAAGLHVAYNRVAQNTYRIIAFSTGNNAIEANNGELLKLNIGGEQRVSISKIEFADATARAYSLKLADATGINSLQLAADDADVFTLGGVKSDKVRKGMNVVRQANGQVRKVMVK